MNEIKIFENPETNDVKLYEKNTNEPKNSYYGYVYAAKWGKGIVKIGMTKKLVSRLETLKTTANYCRVKISKFAVSEAHANFQENEAILHKMFKNQRVEGTELFKVSFESVVAAMKTLNLKDESEQKENDCQKGVEALKILFDTIHERKLNFPTNIFINEPDEPNSKFYIKPFGATWKVPIDSYKVYTRCCKCGKEIVFEFDNLCFVENGYVQFIDLDSEIICDKCGERD